MTERPPCWMASASMFNAGFASRRHAECGAGARVKVMVVDLQDYRENGIAAA